MMLSCVKYKTCCRINKDRLSSIPNHYTTGLHCYHPNGSLSLNYLRFYDYPYT